jgi:hypothetical protein
MLSHGKKRPRLGHQKQGLPGIGREVSGSGDVKANLRKHNPNSEHRRKKSRQLAVGRTKNKEQRTKNKKQRTLNDEQINSKHQTQNTQLCSDICQ